MRNAMWQSATVRLVYESGLTKVRTAIIHRRIFGIRSTECSRLRLNGSTGLRIWRCLCEEKDTHECSMATLWWQQSISTGVFRLFVGLSADAHINNFIFEFTLHWFADLASTYIFHCRQFCSVPPFKFIMLCHHIAMDRWRVFRFFQPAFARWPNYFAPCRNWWNTISQKKKKNERTKNNCAGEFRVFQSFMSSLSMKIESEQCSRVHSRKATILIFLLFRDSCELFVSVRWPKNVCYARQLRPDASHFTSNSTWRMSSVIGCYVYTVAIVHTVYRYNKRHRQLANATWYFTFGARTSERRTQIFNQKNCSNGYIDAEFLSVKRWTRKFLENIFISFAPKYTLLCEGIETMHWWKSQSTLLRTRESRKRMVSIGMFPSWKLC